MNTDERGYMSEEISDESEPLVKPRQRWRFWLWFGVVLLLVIGFMANRVHDKVGRGNAGQAGMNGRSLSLALFSFKGDYGFYPNEETISMLKKQFPESKAVLGTHSSNDFLRQLLVSGFIDTDMVFYLEGSKGEFPSRDKDEADMIATGECGFSYVVWESGEGLPTHAPLLLAPMIKGELKFDRRWAKTAVVIDRQSKVSKYKIESDGRVMVDGKDFFDPSQPYWGGKAPRIAWPE